MRKENEFLEDISELIEQLYFLEKVLLNSNKKKKLSMRNLSWSRNLALSREYFILLRQLHDVLKRNLPL